MERPLGASLEARTSVSPDTPPGPASPDDRPAAGPSKPPSGPDPRPSTAPSGPEPRPLPGPPGRRARDIRLLWTANAADALGTQASGVVLPLLLLGLGHSPAVVGLIAGVSTAAGLVTGPLAAVPADRGARKKVMFWSAVVSSLAMASVALAVADGSPALPHLLGAVLVERFSTACYEAASRGTVALIAAPADVPRVVAGLEAGGQGALVLGPALGGALFQVSRFLPFVVDALSYAVAAVCVRAIRADLAAPGDHVRDRPGVPGPSAGSARAGAHPRALVAGIAAGYTLVRDSALLRLVLVWTTTVSGVLTALYYGAVFTLQEGGHRAAPMGLVLAASGAAGLLGSLTAPRLARRVRPGRALVSVSWLMVPLAAGLAAATGPWAYGALFAAFCLIMPLATVILQSRAIQATPRHLQARAGAVLATAAGGAAALAPALAGLLAAPAGAAVPTGGCAVLLAVLACWTTAKAGRSLAPGRAA
ncbi:MFS transporter [Streptomyces sp. NBC_01754]|uniref:MFS transporter n=1 Tax=Streptomyces sp. NBC_01754 TaxID=2975930 RepID=UPI002DD97BB0|nr:MFS transporter [Streptomyces sp. NBC_01754]WSC94884.1 MFS transporter [Streptomyces sp. NBC_01754]